ncbi:MAG: pilus assembly protein N-terminal domain-containing protein [Planctomycetota bacterium]
MRGTSPISPRRLLATCVLFSSLFTAIPAWAQAQDEPERIQIRKSTNHRLVFDQDLRRGAVGDPEIVELSLIDSREYLARGLEIGQTNVIVYFEDGTAQEFLVQVVIDLKPLQDALSRIDPSITVSMAPDREAVILEGSVDNLGIRQAAEEVAARYVSSRRRTTRRQGGQTIVGPTGAEVEGEVEGEATTEPGQPQEARRVAQDSTGANVINLITILELPSLIEDRISDAIKTIGGENVTIRRVVRGNLPDDNEDILILEGSVENQVELIRVLSVVSRLFLGQQVSSRDIRVLADESGALMGQGSTQSSTALSGITQSNAQGGGGSAGGGQSGARAVGQSDLDKNIARGKVLEVADGRILSFIKVEDIPQVRVQIKLYEVNRSQLLTYNAQVGIIGSDFDQGSLLPAPGAVNFQGDQAARVTASRNEDVQNILSFLGGTLREEVQVGGEHFAIDAAFTLLETQGIAHSISQPSLTVLSGEVAAFSAGGSVPISQSQLTPSGGQSPEGILNSVAFKEFGVTLAVRPLVGDDDFVTLDLFPDISAPDLVLTSQIRAASGDNTESVAFSRRVLATTMRLRDGDAMIIAGLTSRSTSDSESGPPVLRDIPLLGWLFKSIDQSDDEQDLVLVVYPSIVREPNPDAAMWAWPDVDELMAAVRDPAAARRLAGDRPRLREELEEADDQD